MEHLEELKNILYEHFGEDRVDININNSYIGNHILIHYPEVIISNENDRHHTIKDLYIRIFLTDSLHVLGTIQGIRTTLTTNEISASYIHSHLPRLYHILGFTDFCLGNGPINMTLSTLRDSFDAHIWKLFCIELDNFVRTESLLGGPYIKMEYISTDRDAQYEYTNDFFEICELDKSSFKTNVNIKDLRKILEHIKIMHHSIFNWVSVNQLIIPGRSFIDIIKCLTTIVLHLVKSNSIEFKSYYFVNVEYRNNKICVINENSENPNIHLEEFYFKGNVPSLNIIKDETEEHNYSNVLLNSGFGMILIDIITKAVNIENIADGKNNLYYC